jgi:vancomycin permeability regulator SanA
LHRGYALAPVVAAVTALLLIGYVWVATNNNRYGDPSRVPDERVAIVFGAGVLPDGSLSPMLADRVEAAVNLYRSGQVQKLLMTGDNSSPDYDEVSAMKRYAIGRQVPAADITLDYAGFSTYESCYRARAIFGVAQAVLVTQRYHLPRAVYTCRALGVDAVGLGTPDWGTYTDGLMAEYSAREALSTLKALWQVHVLRPPPTFLGPFEGIG